MLESLQGRALSLVIYFGKSQRLRWPDEWGMNRYVIKLKSSKMAIGESK